MSALTLFSLYMARKKNSAHGPGHDFLSSEHFFIYLFSFFFFSLCCCVEGRERRKKKIKKNKKQHTHGCVFFSFFLQGNLTVTHVHNEPFNNLRWSINDKSSGTFFSIRIHNRQFCGDGKMKRKMLNGRWTSPSSSNRNCVSARAEIDVRRLLHLLEHFKLKQGNNKHVVAGFAVKSPQIYIYQIMKQQHEIFLISPSMQRTFL